MAKGKHSAALFEVIKNSRPEQAAQSLRTPKWWFKGRQAPKTEAAGALSRSALESAAAPTAMAPAPAATSQAPVPSSSACSAPARSGAGRSSAVHLDFDKHRKELTFRLRYTTVVVSAFGVCLLVGVAYIVGGHLSHGPKVTSAGVQPNVDRLMNQPAQPRVADVIRPKSVMPGAASDFPPPRRASEPASAVPLKPPGAATLVPVGAETRLPRTIGLNYAIVQTYPPEEKAAALAAREFLTRNGIPCTIETTDYVRNPNWVCLVGTAGFTRISSSDYKGYVDSIIRLGEKFPTSRFDRFRPAAYKWKG